MLEKHLEHFFGYAHFRPGQEKIIENVMQGNNVLGILPTGTGKSICYQLPSFLLPGLTIVVSPLIALMEDQVYQLKQKGISKATYINGHLTYQEYLHRWNQIKQGNYKLVYVSPEKFQQVGFIEQLKSIKISLFVIDEAHCISEWGHDFRTDYLRLKESIDQLRKPPVLCLTATATSYVRNDIIVQLGLESVKQIVTTFDRPNIAYQVVKLDSIMEKNEQLKRIVHQLNGSGIIYVNTRQTSETIAQEMKRNGVQDIEAYHAGLSSEDRMIIQQQFMRGELRMIVATKAFGMGVDKPDVQFVIHYDTPMSMESYVQETGRVARNGEQGVAILFYLQGNEETVLRLIESEYPSQRQMDWVSQQIDNSEVTSHVNFDLQEYQSIGLTENGLELILFYFEKEGLIRWKKERESFIVNRLTNTPVGSEMIMNYFLSRKSKRKKDIEIMLNYINGESCRRENILRYFDELSVSKPDLCCDHCGFHYSEIPPVNTKQQKHTEQFDWATELNYLLPS